MKKLGTGIFGFIGGMLFMIGYIGLMTGQQPVGIISMIIGAVALIYGIKG